MVGITVRKKIIRYVLVIISLIGLLFLFVSPVRAEGENDSAIPEDIDEDFEEGDIKQHDMFEFEAFIKHGDVKFGTAPFDANDEPGNDSSDDNGIVRTWDTVTYPLKITVNPKKANSLKNIKLKISGTLENGVSDGNRINAKFAVGGKEDLAKEEVSFIQEYTIERTGNSIMIPITVEVQGAKHGVRLRPDFKVEVVSVDGQKISNVVTHFDELPSATVSSKVSIKPIIGSGLGGDTTLNFPLSGISGNLDDKENTHGFGLAWGITALPGKSNIRGATFPDPAGKINYEITLSGEVAWDNPARTERLNFHGKDTPFVLLDQRPISETTRSVGAKNTYYEGVSYNFSRSNKYWSPLSSLSSTSQSYRSVLDSGQWEVEKPSINDTTVTYKGYNTGYKIGSTFPRYRADGHTGSPLYGVDERVFSSNAFMVLMPNEYRIGGPNNPDGKCNNVNYRASVKMISYTDENGKTESFDNQRTVAMTFVERNEPSGNAQIYATFRGEPSGAVLGTPNNYDNGVSKGDAATLNGLDVQFRAGFAHKTPIPGGYKIVHRWNTDAFELTKAYAKRAEDYIYQAGYRNRLMVQVRNDRENQHVYYGVAQFDTVDNMFDKFTKKTKDDYAWYSTFDEAVAHGEVGAIKVDYRVNSPSTHQVTIIPLRVKHENIGIGSFTKDGSANIAVANAYLYPDEDRSREIDLTRNRAYHNPAIWNENGVMEKIQSPSRSYAVNFETLAIIPAMSATNLTSNKKTYYNSETVQWTAENSIVIPESGIPDDIDASVTIKHQLPAGLDYVVGSGRVGSNQVDPEVITDSNGRVTLVWNASVSNQNHSIPDVKFQTTINPHALSAGVQSSQQITSIIESELDMRPIKLRTSTAEITVIKVGMVGIHETINKTHGGKNSEYKVTLSPYTTIEDELRVAGLTHIPSNDDDINSNFDGTVELKNIAVSAERAYNDDVSIYLNKEFVYDDKPNKIDVSKNGWYPFTGEESELKDAKSIHFVVNGLMTSEDDIRIELTIQTQNNNFGNEYMNETVINSATDYNLSPISNRVRYEIRPDWELSMERIEIYTNKKDEGLPVRVRLGQRVLAEPASLVDNYTFDLSIYDTVTKQPVATKEIKQSELDAVTDLLIPASALSEIDKGGHRKFEARIENYDEDRVWARIPTIDTDGYVSAEKVFKNSDIVDGKVTHGATDFVTMTSHDLRTNIREKLYESFTINDLDIYGDDVGQITKSGYGYQFTGDVVYESSMRSAVDARYKHHFGDTHGLKTSTDAHFITTNELLDKTIDFYNEDGSTPIIKPNTNIDTGVNSYHTTYDMEKIYIERVTGDTFTESQLGASPPTDKYIDSSIISNPLYEYKNTLYVPVWLKAGNTYDIGFKALDTIGSNRITFDFTGKVKVEASMFHHIDSETTSLDEIMIHQSRDGHE